MKTHTDVYACIEDWQKWNIGLGQAPTLIRALGKETTNSSFLLDAGQRQLVLRLHDASPFFHCDRQLEYRIQSLASDIGLSPKVAYQHPQHHYRVSEFIHGDTVTGSEPPLLKILCQQVNQYQQLQITAEPFSYSQCLQHYFDFCQANNTANTQPNDAVDEHQRMLALTRQYEETYGQQRCLCHHDLNRDNIVIANRDKAIYLLDWEFAGAGIASMDFAGIAVEFNIDINDMSIMAACEQKELELAATIYRYICELYQRALACQ